MSGPHYESIPDDANLGRHGSDPFPQIDCVTLPAARATIKHNSDRNELVDVPIEQEEF